VADVRPVNVITPKSCWLAGLVTMMDGYLCPFCGLVTHQLLSPAEHCDVMCKTAREIGTRSTMSDNQQTAHCVAVSLTARSFSVLSVSLSKRETSVENPGDDQGCHLEPKGGAARAR